MNVLVTGSSGFIGTHLMEKLLRAGHTVLGVDRKRPRQSDHLQYFQPCDLLHSATLHEIFCKFSPQAIVHLAARTDLDEKKDLAAYADNVGGVESLLSAIVATPSVRRCVFTSSQLVCRVGYLPKDENDYAPSTKYGESKVVAEKLIRARNGGGCEWCLARPTTVWGPGMSPHYQIFLGMIQKGRYFHIGRAPLYKSYSYVGNLVFQYERLLEAPARDIHRRVYYLADYDPLSLRAWADAFQQEFNARPIPTIPLHLARCAGKFGDIICSLGFGRFPFNSFRLNNVLSEYVFDLNPTKLVCGSLPFTIREGVKETAKWFKHLPSGPRAEAKE